jgi:peptidyl-prolyl cis-trans isomerase C
MKIQYIAVFALLFSLSLTGCGEEKKVVARVGGHTITKDQLDYRISKMPEYFQKAAKDNIDSFVDEVIVDMLLYDEALKEGLDKQRDTRIVFEEAKKKILIAKLIKEHIEDAIEIDRGEIEKYYEDNYGEFMSKRRFRASHILVKNGDLAEELLSRVRAGEDFAELAKEHSIDPASERGGDIGFFTEGKLVPEFEKAAKELDIGGISDIVETQFGFHIIKLTAVEEPVLTPLREVEKIIEEKLFKIERRQAYNDLIGTLKDKARISVNRELLEREYEDAEFDDSTR